MVSVILSTIRVSSEVRTQIRITLEEHVFEVYTHAHTTYFSSFLFNVRPAQTTIGHPPSKECDDQRFRNFWDHFHLFMPANARLGPC
jgi:hypothetical protein